jgi:hypothetical protein
MRELILAAAGLVAAMGVASACQCVDVQRTVESRLARWPAAFAGEILSKRDSFVVDTAKSKHFGQEIVSSWGSIMTVRVLRSWKGPRADSLVTLLTTWQGGGCGYPFDAGRRYVIYADTALLGPYSAWHERALITHICTGTRRLWAAADELRQLGLEVSDSEWMMGTSPSWRDSVVLVPLADSLARVRTSIGLGDRSGRSPRATPQPAPDGVGEVRAGP